MIAPRTPAAPHSTTTPGTVAAGVITTAKSTGLPIAATVGQALRPHTSACFGFTGYTEPENPRKFSITAQPTLPARDEAPITAIERAAKIGAKSISKPVRHGQQQTTTRFLPR
jgi:hypothetical protein